MESTRQNASGHTPPEGSEKKANEELTGNKDLLSIKAPPLTEKITIPWHKLHKEHSEEIAVLLEKQQTDTRPTMGEQFSPSKTAEGNARNDFSDQSEFIWRAVVETDFGEWRCHGKTLAGDGCKIVLRHTQKRYCRYHKHQARECGYSDSIAFWRYLPTPINPQLEVVELYFDQEERPLKKSKQTIKPPSVEPLQAVEVIDLSCEQVYECAFPRCNNVVDSSTAQLLSAQYGFIRLCSEHTALVLSKHAELHGLPISLC